MGTVYADREGREMRQGADWRMGCDDLFWHMTRISEFMLERVSQATWPAPHNTRESVNSGPKKMATHPADAPG